MEPKKLTEGSDEFKELRKEWIATAKKAKIDQLPDVINSMLDGHEHDYGTICHVTAIAALAGANAVNNSEQGGITGYQAGAVMWEFIREFLYTSNKTGLKITNYDNFLFPQYGYKFDRTIAADNWKELQKAAAENMIESEAAHEKYLKQLDQYQIDLAAFAAKYPDYYERKEHYDHLSVGTDEERSAYYEKLDSGFEFAPQKPSSSAAATAVYAHWRKIVDGIVPFGFRVAE